MQQDGALSEVFPVDCKRWLASEDAAERIADAVGLTVGEILLPEITGNVENVIEFVKDSERGGGHFLPGAV